MAARQMPACGVEKAGSGADWLQMCQQRHENDNGVDLVKSNESLQTKKREAAGSVLMKTWRLSKLDALIVYNETNLG